MKIHPHEVADLVAFWLGAAEDGDPDEEWECFQELRRTGTAYLRQVERHQAKSLKAAGFDNEYRRLIDGA